MSTPPSSMTTISDFATRNRQVSRQDTAPTIARRGTVDRLAIGRCTLMYSHTQGEHE